MVDLAPPGRKHLEKRRAARPHLRRALEERMMQICVETRVRDNAKGMAGALKRVERQGWYILLVTNERLQDGSRLFLCRYSGSVGFFIGPSSSHL